MNRKDNITDRLIEISDKLKKSGSVPPAAETEAAVPTYAVLPEQPVGVEKNKEKEDTAQARRLADGERAKRDLAARIAKDLATLEVELGALDTRSQHLRDIEKRMNEQLQKLEDITPESSGITFAKEIDNIRLDYFRTVGRREAITPGEKAPAPGGAPAATPAGAEQLKQGALAMLLPSAAILIAGLIIAGAIIAVFR